MTREELKDYIKNLKLDKKLEDIIFELIENFEVNDGLLKTISQILNLYADVCDKTAEILEEEAYMYEELASELNLVDEEAYKERLEALKQSQESLLSEINKKVEEFKSGVGTEKQIEEAKQVIVAATTTEPTIQHTV